MTFSYHRYVAYFLVYFMYICFIHKRSVIFGSSRTNPFPLKVSLEGNIAPVKSYVLKGEYEFVYRNLVTLRS